MWIGCYFNIRSVIRKNCCYDARKSDWNYHWSNLCTLLAFTLHKLFILSFTYSRTSRSSGMLIRFQCIYNLWSIHANILSFLDVLHSFYSNFISLFGTNLLTQCPVPVAIFCSQEINIKWSPTTAKLHEDFLWTRRNQWARAAPGGCPEGGTAHQGLACPGGLCPPPSGHPSRASLAPPGWSSP